MLDARMKHDWRIGASLLDAVREGRLRVRDYQTRFPLKPDAPSVAVLPSLVSVNDLREFVADLGYSVQVGDKLEDTVTEHNNDLAKLIPATQAAPAIPESEALPALAANSASKAPVVPFKKAALIAKYIHEWPTIGRDIHGAGTNGLAAAAKAGSRGWVEADALNWARSKGKLISTAKPADTLVQAMHNMGNLPNRKHSLSR